MNKTTVGKYEPPTRASQTLQTVSFEDKISYDKGGKIVLHNEEKDGFSSTRLAQSVAASLSELLNGSEPELKNYQVLTRPQTYTMEQYRAILEWGQQAHEPLYLMIGTSGGDVSAHPISHIQKNWKEKIDQLIHLANQYQKQEADVWLIDIEHKSKQIDKFLITVSQIESMFQDTAKKYDGQEIENENVIRLLRDIAPEAINGSTTNQAQGERDHEALQKAKKLLMEIRNLEVPKFTIDQDRVLSEILAYKNAIKPNDSSRYIPFMLGRKNHNLSSSLTAMDMLSTEGMSRDSINTFVDRLLNPQNLTGVCRKIFDSASKSIHAKNDEKKKIALVNQVYQYAKLFLQMLGIRLKAEQIDRKFSSVDEFKEYVYRIKPELNEVDPKTGDDIRFKRRNGVGMIVECALVRAMDHVYDALSSERLASLDRDAELLVKKIKSIPGARVYDETESGFGIRYRNPGAYFEGNLYVRKKHFFKILLKLAYNRRFHDVGSLHDLLGCRFENYNVDEHNGAKDDNLANAVSFFQKMILANTPVYKQKGGLLADDIIDDKEILYRAEVGKKASTNSRLQNGDITGKLTSNSGEVTDIIEVQFQNVGAMDAGFNKSEVYDLKKQLSAASRTIKGVDISNIKFLIKLFMEENTGISEQSILRHLFFPMDGWAPEMSPEAQENKTTPALPLFLQKDKDKWVSDHWGHSAGFLLPLATKKGGIRFTTRDVMSPDFYNVYGESYLQPAVVTYEYLLAMYERANVDEDVKAFNDTKAKLSEALNFM